MVTPSSTTLALWEKGTLLHVPQGWIRSEIERVGTCVDHGADLGRSRGAAQQFEHGGIERGDGRGFSRFGQCSVGGERATECTETGEITERHLLHAQHGFLVVRVATLRQAEREDRLRAFGREVQTRGGVLGVLVHRAFALELVDIVLQHRIQVNAAVEALVKQSADRLGAELDGVGVVTSQPGEGMGKFLAIAGLVHRLQLARQGIQDTHQLELGRHAGVRGHAISDHALKGPDVSLGVSVGALVPESFQLFVGDDREVAVAVELDIVEANVQEAVLKDVSGELDLLLVLHTCLVHEEERSECLGTLVHRGVFPQELVQRHRRHVLVRHTRDGGLGIAHGASGSGNHG